MKKDDITQAPGVVSAPEGDRTYIYAWPGDYTEDMRQAAEDHADDPDEDEEGDDA